MKRVAYSIISIIFFLTACTSKEPTDVEEHPFVTVEDGQFVRNGEPYYFIGTNFWYGAILGSEGQGGDRERLAHELDSLKAIGIDNLRILVGSDGNRGIPMKVEPTLQVSPGVYNDTILAGLDYLLFQMAERDMLAVLYLNNSWEWSGGYSQYLEWAGYGKCPVPAIDGWDTYMEYVKEFVHSDSAQALFKQYVEDIISRTNSLTGVKYTEDPTIMSWQIGNEPRAFSDEGKPAFQKWLTEVASQIKSLDPNHLVSVGSEGKHGCEQDMGLYTNIHKDEHIDYLTFHVWPYNWGWVSEETLAENIEQAMANTEEYMEMHLNLADSLRKPAVMEEFGFPRDGMTFSKESSTKIRDIYYKFVFEKVKSAKHNNGTLAGCNFWAWGGHANLPKDHIYWEVGDDYTGDPAQEQQGLNSVFFSDKSTIEIIKKSNLELNEKLTN